MRRLQSVATTVGYMSLHKKPQKKLINKALIFEDKYDSSKDIILPDLPESFSDATIFNCYNKSGKIIIEHCY